MAGVKTEVTTAWMRFEESSVAGKWRSDNPGEYSKIKDYYQGASEEARFLRWLLDEERSRCLCAA